MQIIRFGTEEVEQAIRSKAPIVALETAVLTHGLPEPENIEIVKTMAAAVRAQGAIPAVVGLVDGTLIVGCTDEHIELLGNADTNARKISMRDLAIGIADNSHGGTTVASTLWAAHAVGIRVFATGGIGGVHYNWVGTFDVSADLDELARRPVCVVCSGAKSILDIPATLEALETRGIPVLGYQVDQFPQFYSRGSDSIAVTHRADTVDKVAATCALHWDGLGERSAVLLANPCPEHVALSQSWMDGIITEAVSNARSLNVRGNALTPFLLNYVSKKSQGKSMLANLALLESNAKVAGELAVQLGKV